MNREKKVIKRRSSKSKNDPSNHGLRMSLAGPHFWIFYFSLALNMESFEEFHPNLISFFLQKSFGYCGPCIHCTDTQRLLIRRPENNLDQLVFQNYYFNNNGSQNQSHCCTNSQSKVKLPVAIFRYLSLIKNNVNMKLNKTIQNLDLVEFATLRQENSKEIWVDTFWNVLYYQALVYPFDQEFKSNSNNISYSHRELRSKSSFLAIQFKNYVYFYTQIKNILPSNHILTTKWIYFYLRNTPSIKTFQSRNNLFEWIYSMHALCTYPKRLNHSLSEMRTLFESIRSMDCSKSKVSCG